MNFVERINAVLHHQDPDQVPFAPQNNHLHRGELERELRNRGAGLMVKTISTIWSEMPNVRIEIVTDEGVRTSFYHTPVGTVSTQTLTHTARELATGGSLSTEGMIKGVDDYDPVLFMIEDTVYHVDNSVYYNWVRDLGGDGIVRDRGFGPPYSESRQFYGGIYGLDRWIYEQHDHPDHVAKLVDALERRTKRLFPLIANSPAEIIPCGSVNGNMSPAWWEERMLPFYEEYLPLLHAEEKICVLHAHAPNLKAFKRLIGQIGVDVVEAFTPPPVGDLSLPEARAAWGPDTIVWVNFPETIFYRGAEETKQYTIELLRSDPPGNALVIGFTEMGQSGIHDDESERVFTAGLRAVMEAIEEYGNYPITLG